MKKKRKLKHTFLRIQSKKYPFPENTFWVLEIQSLYELTLFMSQVVFPKQVSACGDIISSRIKNQHLSDKLAAGLETVLHAKAVKNKERKISYSYFDLFNRLDDMLSKTYKSILEEYGSIWVHTNFISCMPPDTDNYRILTKKVKPGWDFPTDIKVIISRWSNGIHWYATTESGELIGKTFSIEEAEKLAKQKYPDCQIKINSRPTFTYRNSGD